MKVDPDLWALMQSGAAAWMEYLACGRCLAGLLGVAAKTGAIPARIDLLWSDPALAPYRQIADSLIASWKEALESAPTLTDEMFRTLLVLTAKLDDRRIKVLANIPPTDWEIVLDAVKHTDPLATIAATAEAGADAALSAVDAVIDGAKGVVQEAASGLMTVAWIVGGLIGLATLYKLASGARGR